MKQKEFTKKQSVVISNIEHWFMRAKEEGLCFFGQNSEIEISRVKHYLEAMNRKDPTCGRVELKTKRLNSYGAYMDSGADDTFFIE